MRLGNQHRTAWQNEILQRPQFLVPHIDRCFQSFDFRRIQRLIRRHGQLATEIKQAMLTRRQHLDQFIQFRIRFAFGN
ncbi:hypothetical protein D3C87_1558840 [compost metagenome]